MTSTQILFLVFLLVASPWMPVAGVADGPRLSGIHGLKQSRAEPLAKATTDNPFEPLHWMKDLAKDRDIHYNSFARAILRGGEMDNLPIVDGTVRTAVDIVVTTCRILLPPCVAAVRALVAFYAKLPMDVLLAQTGLVYCFAGGYFPTLFAALQAAQHCGLDDAIQAVNCLVEEAVVALEAFDPWRYDDTRSARQSFTQKTLLVLATIDPARINQAVAALFNTWMGVSTVLEREFAKTIALSVTIGDHLRPLTNFLLAPPAYKCVPEQYHKWVPIILGWGCKMMAMSVAWRIQRLLTAYSSAVFGGLLFSRSLFRMLRKRSSHLLGIIPKDCEKSSIDEIIGVMIAGLGLNTQIGRGFRFDIPFPLSLATWPFEVAERFIQWVITKDLNE